MKFTDIANKLEALLSDVLAGGSEAMESVALDELSTFVLENRNAILVKLRANEDKDETVPKAVHDYTLSLLGAITKEAKHLQGLLKTYQDAEAAGKF